MLPATFLFLFFLYSKPSPRLIIRLWLPYRPSAPWLIFHSRSSFSSLPVLQLGFPSVQLFYRQTLSLLPFSPWCSFSPPARTARGWRWESEKKWGMRQNRKCFLFSAKNGRLVWFEWQQSVDGMNHTHLKLKEQICKGEKKEKKNNWLWRGNCVIFKSR